MIECLITDQMPFIRRQAIYAAFRFHLDSGDVLGDALESLWRRRGVFDITSGVDGFRAWVVHIIRCCCVDQYRYNNALRRKGPPYAFQEYNFSINCNEKVNDYYDRVMQRASHLLIERDLAILRLAVAGYSGKEISSQLEMTHSNMRSRMSRIKEKLGKLCFKD